jgi:antitoxin (DNA-binding transcriptional repressor) of toxin-antitoxin stability system
MDRIEIPMEGDVARWVEAAERGDEVVFTQDGRVRAAVTLQQPGDQQRGRINLDQLRAFRAQIPWREPDAAAMVREMRDGSDH